MLAGRIPRLHKEVIDIGLVDGADGGIGVGICREQRPFRVRKNLPRSLQETHSIHVRHALVRQQQSDSIVTNLQSLEKVQRPLR